MMQYNAQNDKQQYG